jgi:chromosome segregation ATPase
VNKIETKFTFWESPLIGPLAALATTLVILIRPSSSYLALIGFTILGILLCRQWKLKGFILSVALLAASFFLQFNSQEPFRFIAIGISLGIGLLITALTSEELTKQELMQSNEKENLSQNLTQTQHKLLALQQKLSLEQQMVLAKIHEIELVTKENNHNREKLSNCSDQLHKEKKSHEFARALIKEQQQNIKDLNSQIEVLSRNKMSLEAEMTKCQQDAEQTQKQDKMLLAQQQNALAQHMGEQQRSLEELERSREEIALLKSKALEAIQQVQKTLTEKYSIEAEKEELQKECAQLVERLNTNRSTRRLDGMYDQLKKQFNEKSALLDKTRQELFHTQEKLLALQQEWNELHLYDRDRHQAAIDKHLIKLDKEFSAMTQQYVCEINDLQDLVSTLIKGKNTEVSVS